LTLRDNQNKNPLRTTINVAIIAFAATQDSHPDCRAYLIQIVALYASCKRSVTRFD